MNSRNIENEKRKGVIEYEDEEYSCVEGPRNLTLR